MSLFRRSATLNVSGFDVTELRFGFNVEKHLRQEPNTAKITVYNLSEDYRKALEGLEGDIPVKLEAGYVDNTFLIFEGQLDSAVSTTDGSTWSTTLHSDDGKQATRARGNLSFRAGASPKKALEDLVAQLGVGEGNIFEKIVGSLSLDKIGKVFEGGFTSTGSPQKSLEKMLNSAGFTHSVQNGQLEVREIGQPFVGLQKAVVLGPNTGLVDTPNVDKDGRLEARGLLINGLAPGYPVKIKANGIEGTWIIDSVTYSGDTHGNDWYADIEGFPAP